MKLFLFLCCLAAPSCVTLSLESETPKGGKVAFTYTLPSGYAK